MLGSSLKQSFTKEKAAPQCIGERPQSEQDQLNNSGNFSSLLSLLKDRAYLCMAALTYSPAPATTPCKSSHLSPDGEVFSVEVSDGLLSITTRLGHGVSLNERLIPELIGMLQDAEKHVWQGANDV